MYRYNSNCNTNYLFKYVPFNINIINEINSGDIYFHRSDLLDDPKDCDIELDEVYVHIKNIKDNKEKFLSHIDVTDLLKKKNDLSFESDIKNFVYDCILESSDIHRHFNTEKARNSLEIEKQKIKSTILVRCFSEFSSNQWMWSNYGNEHNGICAVYNSLDVKKFTELNRLNFGKVLYTDHKIKINVLDDDSKLKQDVLHSVFMKTRDWESQQEWRIIAENKNLQEKGIKLGKLMPVAVIVGKKVNKKDKLFQKFNCVCKANNIDIRYE